MKYVTEPMLCKRCQLLMPYKEISRELRTAGFNDGTIFAAYFPHDLAGNFRSVFPDTRIVSVKFPTITRPLGVKEGQCLIIWLPEPWGNMDALGMTQLANRIFKSNLPLQNFPLKAIEFQLERAPMRLGKLHYMLFDPGVGKCR